MLRRQKKEAFSTSFHNPAKLHSISNLNNEIREVKQKQNSFRKHLTFDDKQNASKKI